MNCLIIAAGFNTRLAGITQGTPKGLLTVKNKPLIAHLLDESLRLKSIDNFALITNQQYFPFYQEFLASQKKYQKIRLINNEVKNNQDRLGAIGDILFALRSLKWDDDLLILPCDTLINIDLPKLLQFFKYHHQIVNVVTDVKDKKIIKKSLGCVMLNRNKIVDFAEKPEKPKTSVTSVPIYLYPRLSQSLILRYSEKGHNLDSPGSIIPWLIKQTPVLGFKIENSSYQDVGTVEKYRQIK